MRRKKHNVKNHLTEIITFRLTKKEKKALRVKAHMFAADELSAWIRYAIFECPPAMLKIKKKEATQSKTK